MIPLPLTSENVIENGRVILPARFRRKLYELGIRSVVISRGFDGSLYIHFPEGWKDFVDKLNRLPKAKTRGLIRKLMFGAEEAGIDKQGRLLIPPLLREYAGLSRDVIILGLPDRMEIWDKKRWLEYDSKISFEEITEELDASSSNEG
ncbi:MAG: division/cell wall cluster transcriptional repressor MraZ [bacterium]